MFNFMKKGVAVASGSEAEREEKERRKREKKLRKEAKNVGGALGVVGVGAIGGGSGGIAGSGIGIGGAGVAGSMSSEELLRLDEVRRSLKIRGRRKEKEKLPSGITADYSAEFFAHLDIDRAALSAEVGGSGGGGGGGGGTGGGTDAGSVYELDRGNEEIVASVTTTIESRQNGTATHSILGSGKNRFLPPVPPKPPKRGILKGSRSNITNIHEEITIASPDASMLVLRNTMQNELLFEANRIAGGSMGSGSSQHGASFTSVESLRSDEGGIQRAMTLPTSARHYAAALHSPPGGNLRVMTSPSPSADSLTDTTNSSFATPPFSLSPIGESQGTERWSRVHAFEDIELPLPPIQLLQLPAPRELVIRRQKSPRQDFGFSLRKAICLDRSESLTAPIFRPVIFAEPGAGGGATGLLPGDRLLKVNGTPVSELSGEVIIEMIRNSGDSVTVEVQPVSELVELSRRCMPQGAQNDDEVDRAVANGNCNTLKRSASKRFKQQSRNTNTNADSPHDEPTNGGGPLVPPFGSGAGSAAALDGERVWLVHRGGFCGALRLPQSKAHAEHHKVVVQLLHNGEQLTVDEDDIERQNAPALDLIEDICDLKQLNEASVLHCLRQRFASNLIHTKAGPTLLAVNPMAPLSLYSEKVVSMFRGCKTEDMPPHIYSLAQTAYRAMLETRRDQSLIFMGRSGSGKTTSFKHALYYLALAAGSYNNFLNAEKVNSVNNILEAFGNTRTSLNSNATRLTQLLSLDFDQTGQIASASVQVLLPERQRAGRRLPSEHSFHIMSRLLAGAEGLLQKELHLDSISSEDNHPFVSLSQKLEERHRAAAEFMRTAQAFETLNIDAKAVRGIWSILAAIYHLGLAAVTKIGTGTTARTQFANPSAARRAAGLLGVSMEDLTAAAFNATANGGASSSSTSPSKSPTDGTEVAWESLEALVVGLYSEALAAVVALINKAVCTSAHTIASIMLIDTPGFQNPASCGVQTGASLSDLRHNYLQERLQLLFHHTTLVAPRDRYAQELVEIDTEGMPESHPGPLVSLIDKAPQNHVVRSSQRDLREHDRRGMLWLLDEESMYPNSNDETFLERLFSHYGDREHQALLRKCAAPKQFVLQHLQGTNPVLYTVDGWVRKSREHPAIRNAVTLLQDSAREEISRLYIGSLTRGGGGGIVFCGSIAGLEGTQSLRRVSSIRRSFTSAGVKRNSIMLQVKFTVDGIIDTLRRTGTHFVHCYLLQHNAGQHASYSAGGSPNTAVMSTNSEEMVNVPLLRSQLRGSQVLEAARLHRLGFPETVPLVEFVRRFGLLAGGDALPKDITVEQILSANEVDTATYRIGPSQILFRSGVLSDLEAKRDELLSDRIIQLQAYCRGYLARKQVAQRRVQELAVRCIQRNVKAFLAVRDWPWWRLLVRVTPLLNVHRTEEQLKSANEELLALKAKLEKIESDRSELKTENQKLEAKTTSQNVPPGQPSKFLERVLTAMRSSKPQPAAAASTPQSAFKPPPVNGGMSYDLPRNNGSSSSLSSTATNTSNSASSPRPPVPPQAQLRVRKQLKLQPKTPRDGSPAQVPPTARPHTNGWGGRGAATSNYDSDDGLFLSGMKKQPHATTTTNNTTTAYRAPPTPTNTNSSSTYANHNGYHHHRTLGVSSTRAGNHEVDETPVEVSLTLPITLPPLDTTYTSSLSSSSYAPGQRASDRVRLHSLGARSPSPALSLRSNSSSRYSSSSTPAPNYARLQTPPRRVFPQTYTRGDPLDVYEMRNLEKSPVVFDANLSFVLGCQKQPVHQSLRASPSFQEASTSSAYLSEKIQNFLRRTDHVQEEWSAMGRRSRRERLNSGTRTTGMDSGRTTPTNDSHYEDYDTISLIERQRERNSMERGSSVGRSRSTQNILTKAFQLSKTLPHTPTSRSNSIARDYSETDDDDRTIQEEDDNALDELSEMTVDLAEERSGGNMATERLEAETAERLKLEKELNDSQNKVKVLQESTEKLEMELICAKSDLNGISEDEDPDNEDNAGNGVYKLKYERVARELEFTKRRLQTQHEHDLEQLVGLKKQLEKKLSDAYEEVEEQRQVVGQWKRKAQKMTNEMNDLRMLLEEQNARNNLLEKKQRKFDAECQSLQDAARQERQAKDRFSREKDVLIAEKFTLEQSLSDARLELDLQTEKLASLHRELEEMTFGGGTEEEVAQLRRSKNELDRRVKEQDEELDEYAGQVQVLEQAKLRLEMTLETMRKEARREAQQRDEELEEARGSAYKKMKALECQLETEHEERTLLLREKHELERRLASMEDQDRHDRQAEEAANQKLRRDLRKYKALLKDAQTQLERLKTETPGKAQMRQLRNQLEDAESARLLAMKARQTAEAELSEVQTMYEEANRGRNESETRASAAQRDRDELQTQIEENEEELADLMKKYSAAVKQLNTEQVAVSEFEFKLSEMEAERNNLKEQVGELQQRLENVENLADPSAAMMSKRLELRTKELESRLELEQATRARLEVQVNRHKEALDKLQNEVTQSKGREVVSQEALKKAHKNLRDIREQLHVTKGREQESLTKRKDVEKKVEQVEAEAAALKNDLRLALQRIADLQQAMEEGDDDVSESDESPSSDGSLSDLEERLRPIKVKRTANGGGTSPSSTKTLVRERDDNSPRITLTSPSSPHIHKLAAAAKAASTATTTAAAAASDGDSITSDSLKNGDSSYA